MNFLNKLSILFISFSASAFDDCNLNINGDLNIRYSEGNFNVKENKINDNFNKTHNNASRVGANLNYKCSETTIGYTYYSGLNLDSIDIKTAKFISQYFISNQQYGKLTVGRSTIAYKAKGKSMDPFYDTASGTTNAGNNFGFSDISRGFTDNYYSYTSPKLNNFKFNFGISDKNGNRDEHFGIDYSLDNEYKSTFGVQFIHLSKNSAVANSGPKSKALRFYTSHFSSIINSNILFSYEYIEDHIFKEKENYISISTNHSINKSTSLKSSLGYIDTNGVKLINGSKLKGEGIGISAGMFHQFDNHFQIYGLFTYLGFSQDRKQKSIILGFSYKISGGY
ncbi:hypothetical protein [Pseudoalteromonas mariniglutinosa]|uniref:hypothetical protein n=1 Tax=Pseudoalteromonas mariniglutinosa TaxID=206042 RepID=UPI00384B854F